MVSELAGGLDLHGHVGDHELHALELRDRLAELLALPHIADGVVERLTSGYFRDGEATAAAWRNGWFHTGDAMRRSAEGDFYFVDRYKDCIRRKGENISSYEVEGYVLDHPAVAEAAAVGVPSDDGEQEIKVFVVPREPVDLAVLGDWLAERMPQFMTPRYLETVPSLPRTPATERAQKSSLRSRPAGRPDPLGPLRVTPTPSLKASL